MPKLFALASKILVIPAGSAELGHTFADVITETVGKESSFEFSDLKTKLLLSFNDSYVVSNHAF